MPKLTIGYSVLADRSGNVKKTPGDWETLMVVQGGKAAFSPEEVSVFEIPSIGVAKSRNHAIDMAKTDYLVFADDDITFSESGLRSAVEYLDKNPELSMILVQASDPNGNLRKRYPKASQRLNLFNCARAATYEMIVRLSSVRSLGIRFDEDFGAGVENYLGDEYIFIADLIRSGGKCKFVPITIATHPAFSSGAGWGTPKDRLARSKVFSRVFGPLAPIVRLGFGLRRLRELGGLRNLLLFVVGR